jgi:hypothetical protein
MAYGMHPQLERFKNHHEPVDAIAEYLNNVQAEGVRRGYKLNEKLIEKFHWTDSIRIPRGQVNYEIRLLIHKLQKRDKKQRTYVIDTLLGDRLLDEVEKTPYYSWHELNGLFRADNGDVNIASWERPIEGI